MRKGNFEIICPGDAFSRATYFKIMHFFHQKQSLTPNFDLKIGIFLGLAPSEKYSHLFSKFCIRAWSVCFSDRLCAVILSIGKGFLFNSSWNVRNYRRYFIACRSKNIWASSWNLWYLWHRRPANAQSRQTLCCLHSWSTEVDEGSDQKSDI